MPAEGAVPLNAPGWFGCFDAEEIGEALRRGTAEAIVSRRNEPYGIDRLIAIFPDGRAYSWQQINRCGAEVFEGRPAARGLPAAASRPGRRGMTARPTMPRARPRAPAPALPAPAAPRPGAAT